MAYYQRGEKWGIDYYTPNGKRKRELIGSKALAKRVWIKRQEEMASGKYLEVDKGDNMTVGNLFEEYLVIYAKQNKKSWQSDSKTFKPLRVFMGDCLLNQLDASIVEKYRAKRIETDKVQKSTVNRETALLRCMMNKAIEYGYYHKVNPLKKVKQYKENNGRVRHLTKEEYLTLLEACAKYPTLHDMVLVAVQTGMRAGEMRSLKPEHLSFELNQIFIPVSKSGKGRYIPMTPKVKEVLSKPFNFDYCYNKTFGQALNKAGITDFTFHDLRHTYASWLVMSGVDLYTVGKLLGNTIPQRYAHLSSKHLDQAINKLDSFWTLEQKQLT